MSEVCTFTKSQKNGKIAQCNGYEYTQHKQNKEKTHWRCTQYRLNRCPGRITTVEENVIRKTDHSHPADVSKKELRSASNALKEKARSSHSPPRIIIRGVTAAMNSESAVQMPKYESLARKVRRTRQLESKIPKLPQLLSDLVISGVFARTMKEEPFLLFDNGDAENRIVIFATIDNLNFMVMCDDVYMDGTFEATPPLFKQVYTIHGRRSKCHLPLVYALTCKKDVTTYEIILSELKKAEPRLHPKMFMVDFERAAITAAHKVFPDSDVNGCFFHFCKCIYRHIQSLGLQKLYQENSQFSLHIRCLAALAFVPVSDVLQRYNELKQFEFFKEKLSGTTEADIAVQKLLSYMEDTWIGHKPRRTYRSGLFTLDLWNVYELTLLCFPRTNNNVEAWHNAIKCLFGIHPNIFKFIDGIKLEQNAVEVLISKMFTGIDVAPASNKKNDEVRERILKVTKTYVDVKDEYHFKNYLWGLARSIHFSTN